MSNTDFSVPRRQSAKGLILIFFQEGRRAIKLFWPAIVPVLISKDMRSKLLIIGLIILGGLALTLIHAILYYRKFKFHIEDQQFILRKGYLNRKVLNIPLDRIQNVNTNQSVLQQFLNVMTVEIDTAGSAKKELKIHALSKAVAVDLALYLSSHLETKQKADEETKPEEAVEEQILRLSKRDLLKIGISQNHFKTAAIIFIFGFQFFNQLQDYFEEKTEEYAREAWTILSQSGWAVLGFLILFFMLISFLYSMIRTLILFYDLRFIKLNLSYRIVSGLLNRKNVLVPFRKIQQIDWETGPIKKIFGIYRVNIRQATSELATKTKLIEIPGCLSSHIELLKDDLFGSDQLKKQPVINSSNIYFRRNWFYFAWLPAILISPVLLFGWIYVVPLLLWIVLMFFHSKLTLSKSYFQVNNDQIRISSGAISHKLKQMEFHKVQHLEYRQSIFHKKRGVASLKIGNAAGFLLVPYIDEKIAKSLYDYLLYYSETSKEYWM